MWGWLQGIWRFFTAGAGADIIGQLADLRSRLADAETDQEKARLEAQIAALEQMQKDRENQREHSRAAWANPILIWPIAVLLSSTALYYLAIVLDSVFFHSGDVQQMPQFAQGWADTMIVAAFGATSIGVGGTMLIRAIRRR